MGYENKLGKYLKKIEWGRIADGPVLTGREITVQFPETVNRKREMGLTNKCILPHK